MLSTQRCMNQVTTIFPSLLRQQPNLFNNISPLTSTLQVHVSAASNVYFMDKPLLQHAILVKQPVIPHLYYSTQSTEKLQSAEIKNEHKETTDKVPTTYKEKLKQAMAQYGSTVIVFHITISLISLGICYLVVASGLDLSNIFEKLGLSEKSVNKLASSSGTFAAAYLIHKVFAPLRLSITLTCTPFIVRYLRKMGVIKKALTKVEPKK